LREASEWRDGDPRWIRNAVRKASAERMQNKESPRYSSQKFKNHSSSDFGTKGVRRKWFLSRMEQEHPAKALVKNLPIDSA